MEKAVWDGILHSNVLKDGFSSTRKAIADAAKSYDWPKVVDLLDVHKELANTTRPAGISLFAPLHQAAYRGAPVEVIKKLVKLGAWRTLQNARGERPADVAERQGYQHLRSVLAPKLKRRIPIGILLRIQTHFHDVIRGRVDDLVREHQLRLPELAPLLDYCSVQFWFAVPGMTGGFAYSLETDGVDANLVSESWSRVVGGSGQRHNVTSAGSKLVAEGFV